MSIARRKELKVLVRLCLVSFFISCSFIFYDLGSSVAMNLGLKLYPFAMFGFVWCNFSFAFGF
jgi:hypothetical protein